MTDSARTAMKGLGCGRLVYCWMGRRLTGRGQLGNVSRVVEMAHW